MGDYEVAPEVTIRVFSFAGRLFANFPGRGEAELLALDSTTFTIMPVPGVRVRFLQDGAGRFTHIEAAIGEERIRATRR